jgi:putative SOS response-associated peptidase YedK
VSGITRGPTLALTLNGQATFALVRWGLIPAWAKDAFIGFKTINAMSETAADKPAFRDAMRTSLPDSRGRIL